MAQLRDPSDSIEGKLIPHIHLISANQYPSVARLDLQHVTKLLMAAPQIAKDKAPFFWTYLQLPNPGSVILTWQPISKMGVHFASDGFIWMPEQYHRQDLGNGLSIEIYYSRAGFRPGEPIAAYARRRFRLVPSQQGNPNVPQIDMNLWIIHYAQSEPADQCESRSIPYTPDIQNMMTERNILQSYGAIERKEFMLSDRGKWPRIPWPGHGAPRGPPGPGPGQGQGPLPGPGPSAAAAAAAAAAAGGGPYGPPQGRRPVPQQMAYPPAPPPSSRSRRPMPQQPPQAQAQPPAVPEFIDQEEQDVFDILTPRDLALARYKQNHEWMEEVVSSPYSFHQLEPPELGLGLRGQMASLTAGIFNAPGGDALNSYPEKPYVGRLDAGQADAFRKRAQEYIDSEKAEIEKMKAEHAKMMASLKSSSSVRQAEKDLRLSVEERGPEFWRLEGRTAEGEEGGSAWSQKHNKKVDDIVAQVEAQLGHRIAALSEVSRIQDGGYREPVPRPAKQPTPPAPVQQAQPAAVAAAGGDELSRRPSQADSQNSGVMVDDNDIDMGGTAAGLLDQMHTGFSAGSTPLNFPTPGGLNSNAGTPANMNVPSPAPNPPANAQEEKKDAPQDVAMGNTEGDKSGSGDKGVAGEDWVVVPKGGVSPEGTAAPADAAGQAAKPAQAAAPKQASAAGTPAVTEGDANDFSSLGDLDTAGDALAEFGTPGLDGAAGSLGEGLDLNMDMEDSAFGDAFHGVAQGGTPGGQSEGS